MQTQSPTSGGSRPSSRMSMSSLLRRGSKSPQTEQPPPNPAGLLVPQSTSKSSDSEDTRSTRSSASGGGRGRVIVRKISERFRSVSSASKASKPPQALKEADFDQAGGWIDGFRMYNELITKHVSRQDSLYSPAELSKIRKALTENSSCGEKFVHELPEAVFDLALLWSPIERIHRKELGTSEPSWSWTGWDGAIHFPWDPTTCPDERKTAGDFFKSEILNFFIGPESNPWTIRRDTKDNRRHRILYPKYHHSARGNDFSSESNTLRFSTTSISAEGFDLTQMYDNEDDPKEIPCSELFDDGKRCGVIMDFKELIIQPVSKPTTFDFVLLSRNRNCQHDSDVGRTAGPLSHPSGTPIWDGERYLWRDVISDFDENIYETGEWKMLNVMLIQQTEGEDFAERVAVGRIHEQAWNSRNPVKKDVVLR